MSSIKLSLNDYNMATNKPLSITMNLDDFKKHDPLYRILNQSGKEAECIEPYNNYFIQHLVIDDLTLTEKIKSFFQ